MLEKLLGAKFLGGFIGHLVRRQAIFWVGLDSLLWFGLLPCIFGCWAFIILALVIFFQQDD
jgi:hypothetical protein